MRIVYVGNHQPDVAEDRRWSTEWHVGESWKLAGHEVIRVQEEYGHWRRMPEVVAEAEPDLVLWTRTWGMDRDLESQRNGLQHLRAVGIPTAAWHLDKFWDLPRQDQLTEEPWFRCDLVCTADGGNDERFADLGINHRWLPPAIYAPQVGRGQSRVRWQFDVGFVGNWRGGYHAEWTHRHELVRWLRREYAGRVNFWPEPNSGQVRDRTLADVYASVKILVGDSCMVGGTGRYWSDRIPETLGRGGFLVHPDTDGLADSYTPGQHLAVWPLGDWDALRDTIDGYLQSPAEVERIRAAAVEHVREHHTYTVRVREFVALAAAAGLFASDAAEVVG